MHQIDLTNMIEKNMLSKRNNYIIAQKLVKKSLFQPKA